MLYGSTFTQPSVLSVMVVPHLLPPLIMWQPLIQPALSYNKHEPFVTCLETMSNHLMTARAKQAAERMTCFQLCTCLGALLKQTSSILFQCCFAISIWGEELTYTTSTLGTERFPLTWTELNITQSKGLFLSSLICLYDRHLTGQATTLLLLWFFKS